MGSGAESLVNEALTGQHEAVVRLVDLLTPVIQARVARLLLARGPLNNPQGIRGQVEDLTQEVFLLLFADDGRVLRTWCPERGLSLENFVGLVARRRALSILRTGKKNPWKEDPTLTEELDEATPEADPEERVASKEALSRLLARLQEELSPLGWRLFELLFLKEQTVEEVESATGMSRDALYAWRSRLKRLARRLSTEDLSNCA